MYILTSTVISKEAAIPHFKEHCAWLHKYNQNGIFVASGPRKDGLGGVVIVHPLDRAELEKIINEDSYIKAGVATYSIIEMDFKLANKGFEKLLGPDISSEKMHPL